ncbi:MAG: GAF domain-containing protein [Chloroflexota bacterium]
MALTHPGEVETLLELNSRLAGPEPMSGLLARIARAAEQLARADAVIIRMLESGELVVAARSPGAQPLDLEERVPLGSGIAGRVAVEARPLISPDLTKDERYHQPHLSSAVAHGFRSFAAVPLRSGERVVGTISAYGAGVGAFDERSLGLIQAFGDQASIAIEQARLLERSQRQQRRLLALHGIVSTILLQEDEAGTIRMILDEARRLLGVSNAVLLLWDEEEQVLVTHTSLVADGSHDIRVRSGEGASGQAFARRTMVYVPDYAAWQHSIRLPESVNMRAMMAVPLLVGDAVLGVLTVWAAEPGILFDEMDEQLVALFAKQAALALQNARLRKMAEAQADAHAAQAVTAALLAAAEEMSSAATTTDVAHAFARIVPPLFGNDVLVVRVKRDDGAFAAVVISGDVTPEERRYVQQRDPRGSPIFQALVQDRSVKVMERSTSGELRSDVDPSQLRRESSLLVPLVSRGELLGYASVNFHRTQHHFTPREVALAEGLARQAAMALDNLRLRRRDWQAARLDGAVQAARAAALELDEPLAQLTLESRRLAERHQDVKTLSDHVGELAQRVRGLQDSIRLDRFDLLRDP